MIVAFGHHVNQLAIELVDGTEDERRTKPHGALGDGVEHRLTSVGELLITAGSRPSPSAAPALR